MMEGLRTIALNDEGVVNEVALLDEVWLVEVGVVSEVWVIDEEMVGYAIMHEKSCWMT